MKFGAFLVARGVVTVGQVVEALELQRTRRRPLGELGIDEGLIGPEEVYVILEEQVDSSEERSFGRIAVEMGVISERDRERLLELQREEMTPLGQLLVETGAISRERVHEELEAHRELLGTPSIPVHA